MSSRSEVGYPSPSPSTYLQDFNIDAKITNQEIGICGKSVDLATGIIAVGPYDGLTVGGTGNPTLIDNLASEGFTNSRAFSLDLRDVDSPDGKRSDIPLVF